MCIRDRSGGEGGGSGSNSGQSGSEGSESIKDGGSMSADTDSEGNEKNSTTNSSDGQSSGSASSSDSPSAEGETSRPTGENGRSDSGAGGTSGGQRGSTESQQKESAPDVLDSEPQDLSTVRRATDLALEHLRDSIRSTNDDMLKELGWTRKEAEAFLRRWENMQKASVSGSQGQQQAYEQTLRSLGLRTDRVRSSRNNVDDNKGVEVESRRTQPPYEYRERFKAFLKGASSRQVDVNE